MKIVSWNCGRKYREKSDKIATYKPEIAIIQECERKEELIFPNEALKPNPIEWFGNKNNYRLAGMSIMSYTDLEFSVLESIENIIVPSNGVFNGVFTVIKNIIYRLLQYVT